MKPAKPLPTAQPFLSIYTTYYRRPQALVRCLRSIGEQTAVDELEHIVFPDHAGYGIDGGLYGRLAWYGTALRGEYVAMLCDDDYLVDEDAVAKVMAFTRKRGNPPVVVVRSEKGGLEYPAYPDGTEPEAGAADLCCYIVRRDIWLKHLKDYGLRYEGDADFAIALYKAGYGEARLDLLWATGFNQNGRPEY